MVSVTTPDIAVAPRSHSAKRESIIEAAAKVFCQEGFGGSNIDLIAAEAGVSRQTVYNHHGDKEKLFTAVIKEVTERANASIFETLATFPDHPEDLHAELTAFGVRFNKNFLCNRDGLFLRKLLQSEGERCPALFAMWRENGPRKIWAALAARFARLAHAGFLDIDDPDLAARQFLALNNADLQISLTFGDSPSEEDLQRASSSAVSTFLRAFGRKPQREGKSGSPAA